MLALLQYPRPTHRPAFKCLPRHAQAHGCLHFFPTGRPRRGPAGRQLGIEQCCSCRRPSKLAVLINATLRVFLGKASDWIDIKVRSLDRRRFLFKNSISGAKEVSAAARAERGRDPQVEFSCRISGQTKLQNLLLQSLPPPKSEVG